MVPVNVNPQMFSVLNSFRKLKLLIMHALIALISNKIEHEHTTKQVQTQEMQLHLYILFSNAKHNNWLKYISSLA